MCLLCNHFVLLGIVGGLRHVLGKDSERVWCEDNVGGPNVAVFCIHDLSC